MTSKLPTFKIDLDAFEKQLTALLEKNKEQVECLLSNKKSYTWENLMLPLSEIEDELHQFFSPLSHLNSVKSSPKLRTVYQACLPKLSAYGTWLAHHQGLFEAIKTFKEPENYQSLNKQQQKIIDNELRDFKLAGVALPESEKKVFSDICQNLSKLTAKFEENLLEATDSWYYHTENLSELAGLPDLTLAAAKQRAEQKNKPGWLFNLSIPSYLSIMQHADSAQLRQHFYKAYVTRASDQENKKEWDNTTVINDILKERFKKIKLLGFKNFADYSLATKMADTSDEVLSFLNSLLDKSINKAKKEFSDLCDFAKNRDGIDQLNPWDVAYYSEKQRENLFDFTEEQIRPYFPVNQVMSGLFTIVGKLFDIELKSVELDSWHPDVKPYAIYQAGQHIAYCYFDLYARDGKRGGAWMDEAEIRWRRGDGSLQLPAAYLVCNFNSPIGSEPALLTHEEVVTLFHEFGHGLQHMLTTVDYQEISGINGIPWDAVEVASQFLENWAWEPEGLKFIAKHYKTGEPLPNELLDKMLRAKNFQAAMQMVRQLEFSLFDFILHRDFDSTVENQVQTILDQVRERTAVYTVPSYNRFQNGFSHIFAGGYAAGYYSYKWAEVMAADGFQLFKEKGIFDKETANRWLTCILQPGGSEEFSELFQRFRGRAPSVDALLKQENIL